MKVGDIVSLYVKNTGTYDTLAIIKRVYNLTD